MVERRIMGRNDGRSPDKGRARTRFERWGLRAAPIAVAVGSALVISSIAPAATPITIAQPVAGSQVSSPTPTISGLASNDAGDAATVRVDIYAGSNTSGSPIQTLNTTRSGASYSVQAEPLANGTYTAQASQNTGTGPVQSSPTTFQVVATYRAQILADSPDGYWRMNETSGPTPPTSRAAMTMPSTRAATRSTSPVAWARTRTLRSTSTAPRAGSGPARRGVLGRPRASQSKLSSTRST